MSPGAAHCQRPTPEPRPQSTASGTSGEPPACSQASPSQSSRSSNPLSEPELAVGRHVHRQYVVRSHCCRVERPPLVLHPPDRWMRARIKPRTRAQVHVRSLRVCVLDTTKRLASPAAAPPLRKGAELAAIVVARAAIERISRHVLRAARLHLCRVQSRRRSTPWPQLEPHVSMRVPGAVLEPRGDRDLGAVSVEPQAHDGRAAPRHLVQEHDGLEVHIGQGEADGAMLMPHRSPRHLNVARARQQHHLAHAVPLQEGELERGELLLPYDTRGRTLRDRAQERHGRSCRGDMRTLHQRGPQKGAPAEAKCRTAAHALHCRATRRALQHHVRDRAAVPERRHSAHRSSAAAARLHLVRVRARVKATVGAKFRAKARVRVRATAATRLHRLRAQRRRRILPQLANERIQPAQLRVAARRQPPQRRRQPLHPRLP
eukprot:scaffold30960_cov69-Phaeocystis_antarctica.AAC.3